MKRIAVLTSGGDAPGMNAAVRSIVRSSIYYKLEVFGILRGYQGMIEGNFMQLQSNSVSNIIQLGGTILKTARSKEFMTLEGRKKAFQNIKKYAIDGLITIGGDGTFHGAEQFNQEFQIPIIGLPGTIDNDLYGTDHTIGYDTAINTAVEAIDKIRITADSHDRVFFIEVMGRDSGFIAIECGIGCGAEIILVPETITTVDDVLDILNTGWKRHKTSSIIVTAEGDEEGHAETVAQKVKAKFPYLDTKVVVLGHIQRGGIPTAYDRVLASRLGIAGVEGLLNGYKNVMAGIVGGKVTYTPFIDTYTIKKDINPDLLRITEILRV